MKQSTSFTNPDDPAATSEAPDASAIAVPSLTGVELQPALDQVREVGLVPAVESHEVDDEGLVGVVCTQHPDAGTALPHGGVVLLLIGQLSFAEEPPVADEPVPVEEDDWFDIELPEVDQSSQGSPSSEHEDQGAQAEALTSRRLKRPAGSEALASSRRPRRRAVFGAAIALVAIALLAVTVRSCGEREAAAPSPATSVPRQRPATEALPERRPRPPVRPVAPMREHRPPRHHMAKRQVVPSPRVPPTRVVPVPEPPRVSAPAPSVPDCEFCPESPPPKESDV
jgi:hypothetical protein